MVLDGSIRENETARISCDAVRNCIVIKPNHQPLVEVEEEDADMDTDSEEGVEIEEMD